MEVWRHISAGRLAEVFGPGQLDTDRFIRTLGWRVAAQRDLDALAPEARAVLDAYTEGVNAWLDGHRGSLGLAFLAAGVTTRAVDDARHPGVGQGPGLEPRRQLRLGDLPLPRGRSRSGTRRGPTSCSRPTARTPRSSRRRACPDPAARARTGLRPGTATPTDRRRHSPTASARPRPPPGARSPVSARGSSGPPGSTTPTASPRTTASARTTGSSGPRCR